MVMFFFGLPVVGFGISTTVDRCWPFPLRVAGGLLAFVGLGLCGYSILYAMQATA
jgi:hypothetical protein